MREETDKIWFEREGDQWFERNKARLGQAQDHLLSMLKMYGIKPKKTVEVGCSNGYRLAAIKEKFGSDVLGIEPSEKAISDGQKRFPGVRFIRGMAEQFSVDERFDLVIINFVLHWVARTSLLKAIANIDSLLEDGGYLMVGDFGTDGYVKRKYHHLPEAAMFTYKQPYHKIFLATGLYKEIARIMFNHDDGKVDASIDDNNAGSITLLRKEQIYNEK